MSKFFDISKLKAIAAGLVASGKKNAPSLMTAGSIVLGWVGVYIFWKESKKVEQKIEFEEALMNADEDSDILPEDRKKLPTKEKLILYAQYCWPSAVLGLTSTGLAIGANSINLSRLAEMALLTQFMSDKDEKQKKLIEKLKAEVGDKKFLEMKDEMLEERYPVDELREEIMSKPANGEVLFIDEVMGRKFRAKLSDVQQGVYDFNNRLKEKYNRAVKRVIGDAFYSSDNPYEDKIYSSLDVETFQRCIGEIGRDETCGLGELMEFRCYDGTSDVFPWTNESIVRFKEYIDPSTGYPAVCYLDYKDLLKPTESLLDN